MATPAVDRRAYRMRRTRESAKVTVDAILNPDCHGLSDQVQTTFAMIRFKLGDDQMRKLIPIAISAVGLGLASPAAAQNYGSSYGYETEHQRDHHQLRHERNDLHHALRDQHDAAHDQNLDHWEHAQLHRDLHAEHRYQDHARSHEHSREHQWRRQQSYRYGY